MLFKNATLVTMNANRDVFQGDMRVEGGRITALGSNLAPKDGEKSQDLSGQVLMPGFVQGHIHLCQTLFRNVAEELTLLDWLKQRIWPLEGAHTPDSLYATARMGIAELLLGGTTTILDMGTVHHTDAVFEAARESGIRAFIGKAMMDAGAEVPKTLAENTDSSLKNSFDLFEKWDGQENGRLRYAFAPRFVPSCSEALLKAVAEASAKGARIHTHAAETQNEIALVRQLTGKENLEYLHDLGLTSDKLTMAHCVWVNDDELDILVKTGSHICHCPGSNLKLASGIAPIPRYLEAGVSVCLGADGAPCNNHLDIFDEMRLAGLIQKPIHGPKAMPAKTIVELATLGGAAAVGLADEIGSLDVGKKADFITLDLRRIGAYPVGDIYACLAYSATRHNVTGVWVDGQALVQDGILVSQKTSETLALVDKEGPALFKRAGLEGLWSF